jgi:glutathione S-transferase
MLLAMKLYNYFRSSASFRVRIALELKGLSYDYIPVHLVKGEHKAPGYSAVSPSQPGAHAGDGCGRAPGQSMAIIEYLDETHPAPALLPADPVAPRPGACAGAADRLRNPPAEQPARAQVPDARAQGGRRHQEHLVPPLGARRAGGVRAPAADAARVHVYCFGDTPTLADCCLVPQIFNGKRFNTSFDGLTRTMAAFDACMAHPAFQKAQPSSCPDFEA